MRDRWRSWANEELNAESELLHWLVRDAVRAGMESPLREPILDAVDEATDGEGADAGSRRGDDRASEPEAGRSGGKPRAVKAIQGLIGFAIMFIVLYVSLKRLIGDEEP